MFCVVKFTEVGFLIVTVTTKKPTLKMLPSSSSKMSVEERKLEPRQNSHENNRRRGMNAGRESFNKSKRILLN